MSGYFLGGGVGDRVRCIGKRVGVRFPHVASSPQNFNVEGMFGAMTHEYRRPGCAH